MQIQGKDALKTDSSLRSAALLSLFLFYFGKSEQAKNYLHFLWFAFMIESSFNKEGTVKTMVIRKARHADVPDVIALLQKRIQWMDEMNLHQWNKTDYLGVYPPSYFAARIEDYDDLYVAKDGERLLGVMALLKEDPRWTTPAKALYVHHLATDPAVRGLGATMLAFAEGEVLRQGGDVLRLDCQTVNLALNRYYEKAGYQMVGTCVDGAYEGNLMEKHLEQEGTK